MNSIQRWSEMEWIKVAKRLITVNMQVKAFLEHLKIRTIKNIHLLVNKTKTIFLIKSIDNNNLYWSKIIPNNNKHTQEITPVIQTWDLTIKNSNLLVYNPNNVWINYPKTSTSIFKTLIKSYKTSKITFMKSYSMNFPQLNKKSTR